MLKRSGMPISSSSASPSALRPVAEEISAHLKPGAIVSDVGSVKGAVARRQWRLIFRRRAFRAAHPVDGPNIPAPIPASPTLSTAVHFGRRRRAPIPLPRGKTGARF